MGWSARFDARGKSQLGKLRRVRGYSTYIVEHVRTAGYYTRLPRHRHREDAREAWPADGQSWVNVVSQNTTQIDAGTSGGALREERGQW